MLLSPLVKFAAFLLLVGVAPIIVLGLVTNGLLRASAKYLVGLTVIAPYAGITAVLERHRRRENWGV